MIDESIMEKIVSLPKESEKMEELEAELKETGFPITNFNKGGIFYHLLRLSVRVGLELKKLARTIINSSFMKHAEGDWLEIKAADYSKYRKPAVKAAGYITIFRYDCANALQITKGHAFKTLPDISGRELKFYVLENTVLKPGEATGKVLVEAGQVGASYNIEPGKIKVSMIHLEGVDRVANEPGWLYREGAEAETDKSLRERCLSSFSELATRTIEEKLVNAAKSIPGVLYARVDAQHPRGQGTVDIIITGAAGEASPELIERVDIAIEDLKGNYEDYLVKSSEIVRQNFELVIYITEDTALYGVQEQAEELIEKMMDLARTNLSVLYRDSIIQILSNSILNYLKTDIISPAADVELDKNKVIMLGNVSITIKNIETSDIDV